jgi:hypothetical protein
MRTVDFSALKVGDIILSDTPKFGSRVGELARRYDKFVVMSAGSGEHAVVLSLGCYSTFSLLTRSDEGFSMQALDGGTGKAKVYPALWHFTAEEFQRLGMNERMDAQGRLFALMDALNAQGVPESVYQLMREAVLGVAGERAIESSLVDLPRARKVMGKAVNTGVEVYREMVDAYVGAAGTLARAMRTAITESLGLLGRNAGWRNDGEQVVVANEDSSYVRKEILFRTNVGVECLGAFYFVERVSEGRAYVSDPVTGKEVGYMAVDDISGLTMYFNDDSKYAMTRYTIVPVSTREELAVYAEDFRAVRNYIVAVNTRIRDVFAEFDELSFSASTYVPDSVSGAIGYAYDMVRQLDSQAVEVRERADEWMGKVLRLNQQAHGE